MRHDLEERWDIHRALSRMDYRHPEKAAALEKEIRDLLSRTTGPLRDHIPAKPPRSVSSAMASAIFAQPHLSTLRSMGRACSSRAMAVPALETADPPLLTDIELLSVSLALPQWVLEDLREEIDRRAGEWIRQVRLVDWLWRRYDRHPQPERFLLSLLPCNPEQAKKAQVIARNGRLYLAVDHPPTDTPLGLFFGWEESPASSERIAGFDSQLVSEELLSSITKVHGMEPAEARVMLDNIVAVIPLQEAPRHLAADAWRSSGFATLTRLGSGRSRKALRRGALAPDQTGWDQWISVVEGQATLQGSAEDFFDELATERVQAMCGPLYAALMSTHEAPGFERANTHLERLGPLHIERHLTPVLSPLLQWVSSADTRVYIAETLGVDRAQQIDPLMNTLRARWTLRYQERWLGYLGEESSTTEALLFRHLLRLTGALNQLVMTPADARSPHRDTAKLFLAYYLCGAPVQRLWTPHLALPSSDGTAGSQKDVLSDWFLGLWTRILNSCVVADQQSA